MKSRASSKNALISARFLPLKNSGLAVTSASTTRTLSFLVRHECHARTVNELELQRVVVAALNELLGDREGYQCQLQQNIASVIHASATASADAIDEKLLELQQKLLKKANSKEAYDEIADEIFRLRELKQQTTVDTVIRDEQIKRITALQDFIRSQPAELTEFDEVLVRRWFKQITVYEDHYTVELKSGLKVDIDAE